MSNYINYHKHSHYTAGIGMVDCNVKPIDYAERKAIHYLQQSMDMEAIYLIIKQSLMNMACIVNLV